MNQTDVLKGNLALIRDHQLGVMKNSQKDLIRDHQLILHSDFDYEVHKANIINYTEVVIHPDGTIHYAIPSHTRYLENYICERDGISREELWKRCQGLDQLDYMNWLCRQSGCVSVWTKYFDGKPNELQQETIDRLRKEGLLKDDFRTPEI